MTALTPDAVMAGQRGQLRLQSALDVSTGRSLA